MFKTIILTDEEVELVVRDAEEFGCILAAHKNGLTKSYVGRLWKAYRAKQDNPDMTQDEFLTIARGGEPKTVHCTFARPKKQKVA